LTAYPRGRSGSLFSAVSYSRAYYIGNGHFIALALNVLLLATAIAMLAIYHKYDKKLGI
jgi:hypothetical protein